MIEEINNTASQIIKIQPERLILDAIPIREGVLFPSTESVLTFGRELSLNAIKNIKSIKKTVVLITQRNSKINLPKEGDLYEVGTLAVVEKKLKTDGNVNALVKGVGRVKIIRFIQTSPKLVVEVEKLIEVAPVNNETSAMVSHLQKEFRKAVHMGKPVEFLNFMKLMGGVTDGELVDQIASTLSIKTKDKQEILETLNVKKRMQLVIDHLAHEIKVLEIEKDVVHKTQEKFDKHMRESVLRERLKTIQKELGDIDDDDEAADDYEKKLVGINFVKELKQKIKKEIKRLRMMSPNNPESGYVRSWLDAVFELPWNKVTNAELSIDKAENILEKSHYGLEEVKDRILEYVAVLKLKSRNKNKKDQTLPTILCFVGPPGVGKTSIGKSIAEALDRKFIKISLGGINDESEIRGHRRTYVGAMPGKIINGMKQAESMNPVFMLDEIDKIGNDYKGDPSAALLEALDPEQNSKFEDHYIDMPFDLSQVIFITTANTLDTIPPALRDRLEIIRYSGYTQEEKFNIGKDYLFEKVLKANGLKKSEISIPDESIKTIINRYTREAGVRELERTLGKLMRKTAKDIVSSDKKKQIIINKNLLKKYLGPEEYDVNIAERKDIVGQSTGLAWTSVGGELLFIEVSLTPGKGKIQLTGKLGDVMKESAQAALTYVKANHKELGITEKAIQNKDVHIHVPEGAVPKDGPSAGVTITTAIVSAFTKIPVRKDIAMTGEVTLRGRVLRIGGLKEKSIAAHMAGIKTVLIPKENERDIIKIPDSVKKDIKFIPVSHVSENLSYALSKKLKPLG
ncbi:MAG: endopeptidase La [Candidatus Pacebacteria bacterium CG_4_10_14_3_um_filter_34_15]|nr:endopeptidase La [Candidatus Paceibacterota bacterium]OIO44453.1 MAG: endopeptidase La [Candidatus Pacebacteria bacterium CG1_02_43_31]PIQ80627.1 MAG: endopeptidase La [Candidatus Pacebacteria bacterium CG11_big_fil_rev_8_21_14_0_20_34_55]PIX81250.1 MAG: endopeptidase La [Candidatus Pacebacteria bacterium CG_4_10_14_3_um_filter_34_15]PJC44007.1 MAG: endopeptidase La [Candidatus Pacebacteria bacterium CG_4_9_14_0_2_um_filter_34_50]